VLRGGEGGHIESTLFRRIVLINEENDAGLIIVSEPLDHALMWLASVALAMDGIKRLWGIQLVALFHCHWLARYRVEWILGVSHSERGHT
jgi:hypothetical protein